MIQVYTGNGKGKTTAALGLAIRASGAGLKVYIAQFAKGRFYSELAALKKIKNIKVEQFGSRCFIRKEPSKKDFELSRRGMKRAQEVIRGKGYRVIILDEVNFAVKCGLVPVSEVVSLITKAPKNKEIILTGRYAHLKIIACADLVSEVREVKHYYRKGILARKGIEF